MRQSGHKSVTVILLMAVLFTSVFAVSCVTKRDTDEIKQRLSVVEAQGRETQRLVMRMDSIIAAGGQADQALRGEMRYSMSEIVSQISQLLANYNELVDRLEELARRQKVRISPTGSPGAQNRNNTIDTTSTPPPSVSARPLLNCDSTYDVSFLLVRQEEYQKAIDGFATFISDCPDHQNVENAYYWTGESYYSMNKYEPAVIEFEKLISEYPSSVNLPRAMYKLGRSSQELGKKAEARVIFTKLSDDYPNTLEGKQAQERLKDLQ